MSNLHLEEENASSAKHKVICEICKRSFKSITNTHLKTHQISTEEYRLKFPDASFGDFSRFEKWRNSVENANHLQNQAKNVYNDLEILERKRKSLRLTVATSLYKQNHKKGCAKGTQKLRDKGFFELAKNRVSDWMRKSNYEKWLEKFGKEEADRRQLEWQQKNKLPSKTSNTKCEQKIQSLLEDLQIEFEKQFKGIPRVICDFFLPKFHLIIEVDGDYVHANPKKFNSNDIVVFKKLPANVIWEYDKKKNTHIKNAGFFLLRIWESDTRKMTASQLYEDIVRASSKDEEIKEQ